MRLGLILGVLAVLQSQVVCAASYESLQRKCQQKMAENQPQITVEYSFGKLNIDTSKTPEELIKIAKQFNPKAKADEHIQGLTGLKFATKLNVETLVEEIDEQDVCVMPQNVNLRVLYEKPTIYLINSLKPNSCRYNLVLRHEQTHLDIGHTFLLELAGALKQKLIKTVNEYGARAVLKNIYIQDDTAIIQKMLKDYENSLKPIMNSYNEKLLDEHAQLYTPDNYRYETSLCQ